VDEGLPSKLTVVGKDGRIVILEACHQHFSHPIEAVPDAPQVLLLLLPIAHLIKNYYISFLNQKRHL
jgi:hypothetical protein